MKDMRETIDLAKHHGWTVIDQMFEFAVLAYPNAKNIVVERVNDSDDCTIYAN